MLRLALCALLFVACGSNDDGAAEPDAAPGFSATCSGTCRDLNVSAQINGNPASFAQAYFGLSSPGQSESGQWEIYIEASFGGDGQCPAEDSPTPARLLIIAGVEVPESTTPATEAEGAVTTFLDFEGSFLSGAPLTRASSVTVTPRAANPCIACSESGATPDGERFVAVDVAATFAEGSASGSVFATHCDSLDSLDSQ